MRGLSRSPEEREVQRNLILSGGVAHDYAQTSPMLADILAEEGFESDIREDFQVVESRGLLDYQMLTLNCVRWTRENSPGFGPEGRFTLSEEARNGILDFLAHGRGLLALHCATICFDDWPEYRRILGAYWEWGVSGHAPLQEHAMSVRTDAHPITAGIRDFSIVDELYTDPVATSRLHVLIEAEWGGRVHPILWVRDYGDARVCYNALGHGVEAFQHAVNRRLIQRGALWVTRRL